jgi:hypothetical protein
VTTEKYQPLSIRLMVMESLMDANIGRFEHDCFGHTRSKFFKEPGGVDEPRS